MTGALAVLIDGLADPKRYRRTLAGLAGAYAAAWWLYGVVAKSSQDINTDMAELVVWAHHPALGYPKHPPLLAWVLDFWFTVFPQADWAFQLLAAINLGAGIYLATELCGVWLGGEKRAAVPFLLAVIPFYNFLGLKFDQNSALVPLWALTMLAFMRSLETRSVTWAIVLGLAAAAAMLTKYWSFFLVAGLLLALLFDAQRNAYFRSPAPWISAVVFLALTLPHLVWLIDNSFPPLTAIDVRRGAASVFDFADSLAEYTFGTIGYVAPAIVLLVLFVRPSLRAMRDSWRLGDGARRGATLLFWTPLLLPIPVAAMTHTDLLSLWNAPSVALLPVMMLASPLITVSRRAAMRIAATTMAITLIALIASPLVALVLLERGVEGNAAYASPAAAAIETQWRETTHAPLRFVGGHFAFANPITFYLPDRPASYADFSDYLSPWATAEAIAHDGIAMICTADDDWCLGKMQQYLDANPASRRSEVTLTPHWLGFAGRPREFVIATVPPR